MEKAEIVIVGGGVVGASVAYHLTQRGCRDVWVLERENALGLGSTGKATGGVRAQFETDINIKLSLYSLDFFRDWDFDCGYEPRGYLFLATDQHHLDFLEKGVAKQHSLGYREVEIIDVQTIGEIAPGLNCKDIVGGSFGQRDGFIDPLAVLEGFAARAAFAGAKFKTGREVLGIRTENGRVTGVETCDGFVAAEKLLVCSGAWAKDLAKTAGIDLPVEPLRRQIVWARSETPLPARLPMVIDLSDGFHFRPAKNSVDEVLFAYPDKDEVPSFSTEFDPSFVGKIYERARKRAPFLAETRCVHEKCRAGLYENTPDHHAIIGGCDIEGLYFANGFSGHGVMHSPATGRALSEIILDGRSKFLDVSCLSLDRFEKGAFLQETAFI